MSVPEATSRSAILVQLCVAIAVAAAFRILVVLALPAGLNVDTDAYRRIAVTLRQAGVYGVENLGQANQRESDSAVKPTAYRPPLYPLLLALLVRDGVIAPLAIGLLHVVLGAATTALVVWLAHAWNLGKWSWFAVAITACDPLLLNQAAHIMTETLAAFFTAASLASLTLVELGSISGTHATNDHHRAGKKTIVALIAGVVLGFACLARPTFLPWAMLVVLRLAATRPFSVARLKRIAFLIVGILLIVLPWGLRNLAQFGRFKITTTHGGYTLLLGNNAGFYEYLRDTDSSDVWRSDELDAEWTAKRSHTDEFADDQLAYDWARSAIQANPKMFLYASGVRVARFWQVLPNRLEADESRWVTLLRYGTAAWYVIIYLLTIVTIIRRYDVLTRIPWLWGVLLCLTFTLVHSIYWSDMRMRTPLMPFLALVAAMGAREAVGLVTKNWTPLGGGGETPAC